MILIWHLTLIKKVKTKFEIEMFNIDQLANYFRQNILRFQNILFRYLNINPLRYSIGENFQQKLSKKKFIPQNNEELAGDEFFCNIDDVEYGHSNQGVENKYLKDNDSDEYTDEEYDEESNDNDSSASESEDEYEFDDNDDEFEQEKQEKVEKNIQSVQVFQPNPNITEYVMEKNKISIY